MDDRQDHLTYFKEKDIWVDCSEFQDYPFGSEELIVEVASALATAQDKINTSVLGFEFYQKNLIALAPILVQNFNIEEKLTSLNTAARWAAYESYENAVEDRENFEDASACHKFIRLMSLCDDFAKVSEEKNVKPFDEEKRSANPLDSLLEFANLPDYHWYAESKGGGFQFFSSFIQDGILKIRGFLKNNDRTENDYKVLIEYLERQILVEPMMDLFPPTVFIFYSVIYKFGALQSLQLPGFNQAAKILIEEFRKEVELPLPPSLVMTEKSTETAELS